MTVGPIVETSVGTPTDGSREVVDGLSIVLDITLEPIEGTSDDGIVSDILETVGLETGVLIESIVEATFDGAVMIFVDTVAGGAVVSIDGPPVASAGRIDVPGKVALLLDIEVEGVGIAVTVRSGVVKVL